MSEFLHFGGPHNKDYNMLESIVLMESSILQGARDKAKEDISRICRILYVMSSDSSCYHNT